MDPKLLFGIDVECAATGFRHDDRAPCRCAIVSWNGQTLLDVAIQVPGLVSPLTYVTSMTAEQMYYGYPLEEVREMVHRFSYTVGKLAWVANKRFEISKFKFKIPRARTCERHRARSRLYKFRRASPSARLWWNLSSR